MTGAGQAWQAGSLQGPGLELGPLLIRKVLNTFNVTTGTAGLGVPWGIRTARRWVSAEGSVTWTQVPDMQEGEHLEGEASHPQRPWEGVESGAETCDLRKAALG